MGVGVRVGVTVGVLEGVGVTALVGVAVEDGVRVGVPETVGVELVTGLVEGKTEVEEDALIVGFGVTSILLPLFPLTKNQYPKNKISNSKIRIQTIFLFRFSIYLCDVN